MRRRWSLVVAGSLIVGIVMVVVTLLQPTAATKTSTSEQAHPAKAGEQAAGGGQGSSAAQPTAAVAVMQPDPGRVRRVATPPGGAAVVWGGAPTLGAVPGEHYRGRIVVELGVGVAFMPNDAHQLLRQAIHTLETAASFRPTTAPWPTEPIMGANPLGTPYEGRVVVELWDTTATVAVSAPSSSTADTVAKALTVLRGFTP